MTSSRGWIDGEQVFYCQIYFNFYVHVYYQLPWRLQTWRQQKKYKQDNINGSVFLTSYSRRNMKKYLKDYLIWEQDFTFPENIIPVNESFKNTDFKLE